MALNALWNPKLKKGINENKPKKWIKCMVLLIVLNQCCLVFWSLVLITENLHSRRSWVRNIRRYLYFSINSKSKSIFFFFSTSILCACDFLSIFKLIFILGVRQKQTCHPLVNSSEACRSWVMLDWSQKLRTNAGLHVGGRNTGTWSPPRVHISGKLE